MAAFVSIESCLPNRGKIQGDRAASDILLMSTIRMQLDAAQRTLGFPAVARATARRGGHVMNIRHVDAPPARCTRDTGTNDDPAAIDFPTYVDHRSEHSTTVPPPRHRTTGSPNVSEQLEPPLPPKRVGATDS